MASVVSSLDKLYLVDPLKKKKVLHEDFDVADGEPIMHTATLTFNDYQAMTNDTAIYPGKGELSGLMYVALGLGESGEVQGKVKKLFRDGDTKEKRNEIAKELGDVLWYLAQTAEALGLSLGEIAEQNIVKLNSRKERGVLGGNGDNR